MSKFIDTYKNIMAPMPSLPCYGLGELVVYDGLRWAVTAFKPNEKEGVWMYDLEAVDGSDEKRKAVFELGLMKSYLLNKSQIVEKPGSSTHSEKWDRCVEHVEENSNGVNAYAVCTAMLGDESFKSMDNMTFDEKIKMYMGKLGISAAGPIPRSLLAAQDLEGTTRKGYALRKSTDLANFAVWYYDKYGSQKCSVYNNMIDAEAYARILEVLGFQDIKIMKGVVEQTGKQLTRIAIKAEDAETSEKKSLTENIKAIQLRRQKATLEARGVGKSFSQGWKEMNKK